MSLASTSDRSVKTALGLIATNEPFPQIVPTLAIRQIANLRSSNVRRGRLTAVVTRRPIACMSASPIALARVLHAALEAGKHGEELRPLFTEDAVTLEHPNLVKPRGASVDLQQMLTASVAGANLLSRQSYDVHSALEHGSMAIVRLAWTGRSLATSARSAPVRC